MLQDYDKGGEMNRLTVQNITIAIQPDGPTGPMSHRDVRALTDGCLAIHRTPIDGSACDALWAGYTLTHIPTGRQVVQDLPLRAIYGLWKNIRAMPWQDATSWPQSLRRKVGDAVRDARIFAEMMERFDLDPTWEHVSLCRVGSEWIALAARGVRREA